LKFGGKILVLGQQMEDLHERKKATERYDFND
jgi:hypothetical protein